MSAKKKQAAQHDPEEVIESAINRSEDFIYRNGKGLLIALGVIVLLVGGYFGYKYLVQAPRNNDAAGMIFVAEQLQASGEYQLALDGDQSNAGLLEVIEKYGSTPIGNLAKYYAGQCYLHLDDYENALKYLGQYKTTEGAPNQIINADSYGLQGDALSQLGRFDEAAKKYEAAYKKTNNSYSTPKYLKKAGVVYEKLGKYAEAKAVYQRIFDEYPSSMEGRDIEKYLGAVEQK